MKPDTEYAFTKAKTLPPSKHMCFCFDRHVGSFAAVVVVYFVFFMMMDNGNIVVPFSAVIM